jgi:serine protease AprX
MNVNSSVQSTRRKAVWGPGRVLTAAALSLFLGAPAATAAGRHGSGFHASRPGEPNSSAAHHKLDKTLTDRAGGFGLGTSKVIVTLKPGYSLPGSLKAYAKANGRLGIINGHVVEVPNRLLKQLANDPAVEDLHFDRPLHKDNYRTTLTTGARAVQEALGYTGAGIGVAIIDSGVTSWHDDLTNHSKTVYPFGNQRISAFVDFVHGRTQPYDDDGHGTHVAGIIAGNGYDTKGQKAGSAPDASLAVLKVLDGNGQGTISNLIAALDWVLANHAQYNIRVVNMSVGAGVTESYWTDPLTLAAKRVVDAGVVVVAAAGNAGKNAAGQVQYGAIASPGNAPWVLTVGAYSTNGTANRADDTIATFSSRGPTYLDYAAKPDLVAPGVGTYSLAAPGSTLVLQNPLALLGGLVATANAPYMSLSGTSMAAPVVSGTIALMLQANPTLTPNAVKAILEYTAQTYTGYNALTQGAGYLNALGAVRLARFYATARAGDPIPEQAMWSKHLIWGNHMLSHGAIDPRANAFAVGTNWGVAMADDGDNIVWGTADSGDNIVWGTADSGDNIVWGTADDGDNIVWGTDCGGNDCDNIVWGTADVGDNIVWGTADAGDNIVWGTADSGDNIVWGTADSSSTVWGMADSGDNIVWGTADDGDNIVWGTAVTGANLAVHTRSGTAIVPRNLGSLTDEQIFSILESIVPPPSTLTTTFSLLGGSW